MAQLLNETKLEDTITLEPLRKQLLVADDMEDLRSRALELLAQGTKKLVLDFSNVSYASSTALGRLVALHVSYGRQAGKVHLCGCGSQMRLVLEPSKADTVVPFMRTPVRLSLLFDISLWSA